MPDPAPRSIARSTVAVAAVGLALTACKSAKNSDAPDIQGWTLAEIEAELERNDDALSDEGIMVAVATPPAVTVSPPPGPDVDMAEEDGGGGGEGEGVDVAPEPTPDPEPMPATMDDYDSAPQAAPEPMDDEMARSEAPRRARRRPRAAALRREARQDVPTRCERICDLAESTCELEAQICDLALHHPDEPRYEQACLRAEQQCAVASTACQRCVD